MTGYYCQTIPDYAKIAAPLIASTRKGVTWDRSTAEQTVFKVLKEALQSNSISTYPQTDKHYKL